MEPKLQLYSTPPNSAIHSKKNWTGLYIGSDDSLNVGNSRLLIPPLMTKYYENKVDNKQITRNYNKYIIHKRSDYWKPYEKMKRSMVLHENTDGEEILHSHKHFLRNSSVKETNSTAINYLTRKNQREMTLSNNSGVKHFEDLNKHSKEISLTTEKTIDIRNLIEPNKLVTELLQQRNSMLGIDVCLRSLDKRTSKNLKALLPKCNSRGIVCRSAISPIRKTNYDSKGCSNQLSLNLPKSAPANHQSMPPFVPGAVFYCRFGQLNKVDQLRHKAQKINSGSGEQGTGFLSRFGQQKQNIIDQLCPTSNEVEQDKISQRESSENVRNKADNEQSSFLKESATQLREHSNWTKRRTSSIEFEQEALDCLGSMTHHSAPVPFASLTNASPVSSNNGAISSTSGRRQAPPPLTRRMHSMSYIDIALHNEDGEKDDVEIDVADDENGDGMTNEVVPAAKPILPYARRQSISDRLSKRRNSELAAEIIRLSAENRRREFVELLDEHSAIVQEIEKWEPNGICEEEEEDNDKENGS